MHVEQNTPPNLRRHKIVHFTTGHRVWDVRIFEKECSSLARAGYEVILVVPHARDQIVGPVRVKALPINQSRWHRFTLCAWQACREVLREPASVYHFHDPELVPVGVLLRVLRRKVIYDVHDDLPGTFVDKEYIPKWLRQPLTELSRVLEDAAAAHFSAIVTATPAICERFARRNQSTVAVQNFALNGDLSPANPIDWKEREPVVAFVGGMAPERGIRELVDAMSFLPESSSARLALAGWYSPPALREQLVRSPGWARVDEIGHIDRKAVARLMARVSAGVVTFLPRPNHVRAGPNKIFEYMAAGIPVIASDFPLWRKIVDDAGCGLLVDSTAPRGIAKAIEYLLAHPDEAERMGNRGRVAVEKLYSWRTEEQKLLQLYRAVVGSPYEQHGEFADAGAPV